MTTKIDDQIAPGRFDAHDPTDVEVRRLRSGRHVLVPRSLRNATGQELEVAARLQEKAAQMEEAGRRLASDVAIARRAGMSWDLVGWCVGMTGAGARKRWMGLGVPTDA